MDSGHALIRIVSVSHVKSIHNTYITGLLNSGGTVPYYIGIFVVVLSQQVTQKSYKIVEKRERVKITFV